MKWLRDATHSFKVRLVFFSLLFFMLIVIVLTGLVSRQYSRAIERQQEKETLSAFATATRQIDEKLNDLKLSVITIQESSAIESYIWDAFFSDADRMVARMQMTNALSAAIQHNRQLYGVLFLKSDGALFGNMTPWSLFFEEEKHPLVPRIRQLQSASHRSILWDGPFLLSEFTLKEHTRPAEDITLICGMMENRYTVSYAQNAQTLTTLILLRADSLQENYDYLCGEQENIYLLTGDGVLLSGMGSTPYPGPSGFWAAVEEGITQGTSRTVDGITGERLHVMYQRVVSTGWYLVKTVPWSVYNQQLVGLQLAVLSIALALFVIIAILYILWARRFTASLTQVGDALMGMQQGDLSVRMDRPLNTTEFELIRSQFNQMADSIQAHIATTQRMEREQTELEMRALQTQLSPHMIFNSITAIRWTATMLGVDQVSEMLIALAELLRPVFREWRLDWTLREELAYMQHYIKLLRLRYGNILSVDVEVCDELLDMRLPRFTFQPILENCCEHGIDSAEMLHIRIEATLLYEVRWQTIIRDTGTGIAPERLSLIREQLHQAIISGNANSIGLYNVHRRIVLLCGEGYGLAIESEPGEGTSVCITMPTNQ